MTKKKTTIHIPKNINFPIPPYLPDTEVVRKDLWKMYNNIAEINRQLGTVLKQLKDDGLLENTIVFFYKDHGKPLPRQKRLIYDSGLNTPMIIRFPNKQQSKTKDDQLVSFIDFAPTLLSLTGINPPDYMQRQAFLDDYQAKEERKFIHDATDRFDTFTDAIHTIHDKQFKYIRNYRPRQGYYLPLDYRERIPTMQKLLRLRDKGKLDDIQALWFRENKSHKEFYDYIADPHELHNLADDPAYNEKLEELRAEINRWIEEINDQPNLPKNELISQLWGGKNTKPLTSKPIISSSDGRIAITCSTEGASLGYKIIGSDGIAPKVWSVYQKPFSPQKGTKLLVKAHRIGFKPSEIIEEMIYH